MSFGLQWPRFSSPLKTYPASVQHYVDPRKRLRNLILSTLLIGGGLLPVQSIAQVARRDREELPNLDTRAPNRTPTPALNAASAAATAGVRQRVKDVRVDRDDLHGSVGFVRSNSRFLTPAARVRRDYATRHNGLRSIVWEQELDEIRVFGVLRKGSERYG